MAAGSAGAGTAVAHAELVAFGLGHQDPGAAVFGLCPGLESRGA